MLFLLHLNAIRVMWTGEILLLCCTKMTPSCGMHLSLAMHALLEPRVPFVTCDVQWLTWLYFRGLLQCCTFYSCVWAAMFILLSSEVVLCRFFCKCCLLQAFVWMRSSLEMWGLWYCAFSCPANWSWCLHVYTMCLAPSTVAIAPSYGACICDTVNNYIKWECHAIVAWHWHF